MCTRGGGGVRRNVLCFRPWIALGGLVVIKNDEGDHLKAISAQSTPFNTTLEWCDAHTTRAPTRLGSRGHLLVQKWSRMRFSKVVPRLLGVQIRGLNLFGAILDPHEPMHATKKNR